MHTIHSNDTKVTCRGLQIAFTALSVVFFIIIGPSVTSAQSSPDSEESQEVVAPPETVLPEGAVSCFDYYRFGSVQVDVSPTLAQTIPGVPMTFAGKIKNNNEYPIVDGQVYAKIFHRSPSDTSSIQQNGYPLVDFILVADNVSINARSEKDITFEWLVPQNADAGDYQIALYFTSAKRFNLLGLTFTDDITGNTAMFSVTRFGGDAPVIFDKNTVTLNDTEFRFAAFIPVFAQDEEVTAHVSLINPNSTPKEISLIWTVFSWDGLLEKHKEKQETLTVLLQPNEIKKITYTVPTLDSSVSYIVAEAVDGDAKSILNFRFGRQGIPETRINFPAVMSYPLTAGVTNTMFSCVHSTNLPVVPDNTLILTVRDENDNVIDSYEYKGDITGAMMGLKKDFVPTKTHVTFSLTATLLHAGTVVDEVTQVYDCARLNPESCPKQNELFPMLESMSVMVLIVTIFGVLVLIALYVRCRKNKTPDMNSSGGSNVLLMLFILGGIFAGGNTVLAGSVTVPISGIPSTLYSINNSIETYGYARLQGSTANVTYVANFINNATGLPIVSGASLPVGATFTFVPKAFDNTDITWFLTGAWMDSPYGKWTAQGQPDWPGPILTYSMVYNSAYGFNEMIFSNPSELSYYDAKPASCSGFSITLYKNATCSDAWTLAEDEVPINAYLTQDQSSPYYKYGLLKFALRSTLNDQGMDMSLYTDLFITQPTISISTTGPVSCTGYVCTVTGTGPIQVVSTFQNTSGRFKIPGDNAGVGLIQLSSTDPTVTYTPYTLNIPATNIPISITGLSTNNAPSAPTVTPQPFSGNVSTSYPFTFTATDPDVGDTIRYGIDWNNDGSVDQLAPAGSYVSSGVSQSASNPAGLWTSAGTHTFRVRTEDNKGGVSAWTTASVTISPALTSESASDCIIQVNQNSCSSTVTWSIINPSTPSIRQNGAEFSTAPSSAGTARTIQYGNPPANTMTFYDGGTLLGSRTPTASCAIGTVWNGSNCVTLNYTFNVSPTTVPYNGTTTVTWNVTNPGTLSCEVSGSGGGSTWIGTNDSQIDTLTASRTYILGCGGLAIDSQSVTVNTSISLNASPRIVEQGDPTTLSWTVYEAGCTLSGGPLISQGVTGTGSVSPTLTAKTTFTLSCPTSGTRTVTVDVIPKAFET